VNQSTLDNQKLIDKIFEIRTAPNWNEYKQRALAQLTTGWYCGYGSEEEQELKTLMRDNWISDVFDWAKHPSSTTYKFEMVTKTLSKMLATPSYDAAIVITRMLHRELMDKLENENEVLADYSHVRVNHYESTIASDEVASMPSSSGATSSGSKIQQDDSTKSEADDKSTEPSTKSKADDKSIVLKSTEPSAIRIHPWVMDAYRGLESEGLRNPGHEPRDMTRVSNNELLQFIHEKQVQYNESLAMWCNLLQPQEIISKQSEAKDIILDIHLQSYPYLRIGEDDPVALQTNKKRNHPALHEVSTVLKAKLLCLDQLNKKCHVHVLVDDDKTIDHVEAVDRNLTFEYDGSKMMWTLPHAVGEPHAKRPLAKYCRLTGGIVQAGWIYLPSSALSTYLPRGNKLVAMKVHEYVARSSAPSYFWSNSHQAELFYYKPDQITTALVRPVDPTERNYTRKTSNVPRKPGAYVGYSGVYGQLHFSIGGHVCTCTGHGCVGVTGGCLGGTGHGCVGARPYQLPYLRAIHETGIQPVPSVHVFTYDYAGRRRSWHKRNQSQSKPPLKYSLEVVGLLTPNVDDQMMALQEKIPTSIKSDHHYTPMLLNVIKNFLLYDN